MPNRARPPRRRWLALPYGWVPRAGTALALLLSAAALALSFPQAGRFLVVEDPFTHADVALVLSGLPTSRAFAARDLYRQGRVDRIVVIPEPPNKIEGEMVGDAVVEELARLRLLVADRPQWAEQILMASGIPRAKVALLPEAAHGTIGEAELVKRFFGDRPPPRVALITSKSASRRARMIFRRIFRQRGVRILAAPTPYDLFEPARWWTRPRTALTVVTEYQKLVANALTLSLRGNSGESARR